MKKLLIVEDDEIFGKAYLQKFADKYELRLVKEVAEAFKLLSDWKPDAILTDLYMPGNLNGMDLLKIIKTDIRFDDIPVIVVTNLPDSIDKVLEMGVSSCFMKSETNLNKIEEEINRVTSMMN